MAEAATAITVGSAAFDVIGGIGGAVENQSASNSASEAAYYRAEAAKIQNRINKVNSQRQREMDIEQVTQAESSLLTSEGNIGNGTVSTSAYKGSQGALASSLKGNLGFGNRMQQLQDQYAEFENKAISAGNDAGQSASNAQGFQSFSQIGQGAQSFSKLFN